ncbi:MAG TPA: RiPP maturation radical SAM C-methyltransferase [Pyrinomonadaceae bacterium]|nr:RiPP maturation radical SAM C-methyltransferase [Pyrinomonadaceae bacterium]
MDVVLVSMPFAEVQRPSIALGLLHASLRNTEIQSEVVYANFGLAERIGLVAYQAMQNVPTDHLLGEWCFASRLFPTNEASDEEYLNLVLEIRCHNFPAELEERKDQMRWVRRQCASFIDWLADVILTKKPKVVGCSSVFQQHCASLALLKRIHELSSDTILLMGGANCEGEMGVQTLQSFGWVDCIVSGEADAIFPELCKVLLDQGRTASPASLPDGAVSQRHLKNVFRVVSQEPAPVPRSLIHDMDSLPLPDYSHYFQALKASTLTNLITPELLAESSRGCWWGEKFHCTFCGLNGAGMKYRLKSPERVLDELAELKRLYGIGSIQFVDNILDMSYFKTVLPRLADSEEKYALFYETKANLKREQVQLLARAGVRWIQPGIESLDDRILTLLAKGNSTLMNLQLLKWCCELGIDVSWNMLSGIPGESDSWYANMADWLPAISHLQPPTGVSRVRYDRFSPYHMRPNDFGLTLEPSRTYPYVYPLSKEALMRLAYSFEDNGRPRHMHRAFSDEPGQQRLQYVVVEWNQLWRRSRPVLAVYDDDERLRFFDTRPCAIQRSWIVEGLEADIYRLCDSARSLAALKSQLGREVSNADLELAINNLLNTKVLLSLNDKLLAIGVNQSSAATSF